MLLIITSELEARLINRSLLPRLPGPFKGQEAVKERETLPDPPALAIWPGSSFTEMQGRLFDGVLILPEARRFYTHGAIHDWWFSGPALRLKATAQIVDLSGVGLRRN